MRKVQSLFFFLHMDMRFDGHLAAEGKIAEEEEEDSEEESTASRFTAHLLKFLLRGFLAKDKSVRYRVTQTVAEMVSHLGEIEYVLS